MFAALDPRVWAAFALAIFISGTLAGGYGYYKGHAIATAELTAKYATVTIKAQQEADKKLQAAQEQINAVSGQLQETIQKRDADVQDLVQQVRDAKLHPTIRVITVPSIPAVVHDGATTAPANSNTTVASERGTETRAELVPEAFGFLIALAVRGDNAILQLNACIDSYNAAREKLK